MTVYDLGQGNTYALTRHKRGQVRSVEQVNLNVQNRKQLLRTSTAMSCVLAAVTTVTALSGLLLSATPVLAQQVSGHGGSGGKHAISRPRAGGSGAAANSISGGGGGGGPKAWGGGLGGRWNQPGTDGTKGANGVAKGWIWAPGNFGHDGGSGGGGGGGGVMTVSAQFSAPFSEI